MKRCLIFLDALHIKNSLELLDAARRVHEHEDYEVFGFIVGTLLEDCLGRFDTIFLIDDPKAHSYDVQSLTHVIGTIHADYKFDSILVPGTWIGRMLAPRLAIKLHTGLTADVTEIVHEEGILKMIRPAYSGHMMAGIINKSDGPILMSIRQNIFSLLNEKNRSTQFVRISQDHSKKSRIRLLETKEKEQTYDIRDSKILLSGGKGISQEFNLLEQLAEKLHGQVAASRSIVDLNIAPRSIQVGQSGKTVSPTLYMAFGISGAIQHIEGLREVDYIISINMNINAPICSISDIVVEGDAAEFVKILLNINFIENT